MKRHADARRRPSELAPGSRVWLSTRFLPLRAGTRKLAEKFTGPFSIVSQVAPEAYRLALPRTWKIHPVFHSSQLKLVQGEPRVPPPVHLEDDDEYEVQSIIGSRIVRGKQ